MRDRERERNIAVSKWAREGEDVYYPGYIIGLEDASMGHGP